MQNGFYRLEFCADPENAIEEEREDNNCLVNHLKLTGMGTPSQRAEESSASSTAAIEGVFAA